MQKRRLRQRIAGIAICVILITCMINRPVEKDTKTHKENNVENEKVVVHTTPPCDTGSIVVYAESERVFSYYGKIDIANSGWNGKPIKIIVHAEGSAEDE